MFAVVLPWQPRIFSVQLQFFSWCCVGINDCNATRLLYRILSFRNSICNSFASNGKLLRLGTGWARWRWKESSKSSDETNTASRTRVKHDRASTLRPEEITYIIFGFRNYFPENLQFSYINIFFWNELPQNSIMRIRLLFKELHDKLVWESFLENHISVTQRMFSNLVSQ